MYACFCVVQMFYGYTDWDLYGKPTIKSQRKKSAKNLQMNKEKLFSLSVLNSILIVGFVAHHFLCCMEVLECLCAMYMLYA